MKQITHNSSPSHAKGFSLVELMVAMLLGLILVGAATGVMLSNTQSFKATQKIAQTQDGARLGFELMARDIRQAGSIPCGNNTSIDNIISAAQSDAPWYLDWGVDEKDPLVGHAKNTILADLNNRADDTEALTVLYADNSGTSLADANTIHNNADKFSTGDIAFLCEGNHASIFKATIEDQRITASESADTNTTTMFGDFKKNAVLSKLKSRAWYIGKNTQGGRSLYLAELTNIKTTEKKPLKQHIQLIEITSGVIDLRFEYHLKGANNFIKVGEVGDQWPLVNAIKITLVLLDEEQPEDSKKLTHFSSIVAVRNQSL